MSRDGLEYEVADVPVLVGVNDVKSPPSRPDSPRRMGGAKDKPRTGNPIACGVSPNRAEEPLPDAKAANPSLEEELELRFFSILGKGGI